MAKPERGLTMNIVTNNAEQIDARRALPAGVQQGHISISDYLRDVTEVRAVFEGRRSSKNFDFELAPSIAVYFGDTTISLTPDVWRLLIEAVTAVLPGATE
jgi:hypothetical protein